LLIEECLQRWEQESRHGIVDTGRYRCPFVVWGRGPSLVLIPGMASTAINFVLLMARLQEHFCCISYNLPDGEQDGARLMEYRHDDLVSDLFALLDHLGIRQSYVLGSSLGSTVALAAMHAQPGRFARAVLQGGFARRPLAAAEIFCAHWARYWPGRLGQLPLTPQIITRTHRAPFLQREPAVWDFFIEHTLNVPLRAFASRALMLSRLDLRPILPHIQKPVMMVCGDADPLVGKSCERELYEGLPGVARAEIEQCGHQPQQTHPEVLAEIVTQFLK
jgi:pimeloyl-ACP methyl ester carboxylesterase